MAEMDMNRTDPDTIGDEHLQKTFDTYIKNTFKYKIMNALRGYVRKRRREIPCEKSFEEIPDVPLTPSVEQFLVDLEVAIIYVDDEKLASAMKKLSRQQKMVIGYEFVLGMKPGEIARLLGIKPHSAYKLKNRAIISLRKHMGGKDNGKEI